MTKCSYFLVIVCLALGSISAKAVTPEEVSAITTDIGRLHRLKNSDLKAAVLKKDWQEVRRRLRKAIPRCLDKEMTDEEVDKILCFVSQLNICTIPLMYIHIAKMLQ